MRKEIFINDKLYYKGGNKEAILLIHGFTGRPEQTDLLFKYFKSKDYTIVRPPLPGHTVDGKLLNKYGPDDWCQEVKWWIDYLYKEFDKIYVIAISFGGNMILDLSSNNDYKDKIKAIALLETPVLFNLKINILINVLQPVLQFLKIDVIKKNRFLYRSNYKRRDLDSDAGILPIKTTGQVRDFIKAVKGKLSKVKTPCLIVQSRKSDLLRNGNAKYIYDRLGSDIKDVYYVDIDNHDLNLLDDEGRMLLLENIYKFFIKF